ncbi:MAG: cysteine synthase family protein [Candidatus Aenigmarchaeota archaeon]|nr:cysteine synthase family protein [Candidatus Aenigmarchaeota archaeon]MDW8149618.1 cysteine synthase family protein [Candidatus Aenigmarchaeota archaeon]
MKVVDSIIDLIGNTPMVKIKKLTSKNDANIFAKLEKFNVGGSVKDRIVKFIIEKLEKEGKITKDKIIVEATSGNTGIALALIAAVKGYKTLIIMPENASEERKIMIKALGSDIIFTKDEIEAIELAKKIVEESPEKYLLLGQFSSQYNPQCHYETTGKEIIEQTEGKVDMLVATIGTTGTIVGVGRRLKEFNKKIKIIAVEPLKGENIPGLINLEEYKPPIFDTSIIDEIVDVSLRDAIEMSRRIAREEGIFVGISSGAAMCVAVDKAKELGSGKNIVVILPDGGERYFSMDIFK